MCPCKVQMEGCTYFRAAIPGSAVDKMPVLSETWIAGSSGRPANALVLNQDIEFNGKGQFPYARVNKITA